MMQTVFVMVEKSLRRKGVGVECQRWERYIEMKVYEAN